MKKFVCMLLAAMLLLCASAGAEEALTMRQIMEANTAENLMAHYGSVHIRVQSGDEMWERYMGPEGYYYGDTQESELYQEALYYVCKGGKYEGTLYAGEEMDKSAFDSIFFSEEYIDLEEILYQSEYEGSILLKTQLHLSEVDPGLAEEGIYLVVEYALRPDTLAVLALKEKLRFDNGQSLMTDAEITIEYGAAVPEGMQVMLDRLHQADVHTIKVVLNPGAEETVVSAAVPEEDEIKVIVPEEYALYADAGCTEKWNGAVEGDAEVYAAKGK